MKQKLWGGAFAKEPSELAWSFGQSIDSDGELWRSEILVSIAHAKMLAASGIISASDGAALVAGLEEIYAEILRALSDKLSQLCTFEELAPGSEDIHAALESLLRKRIGDVADRLHAGRSRNDQIATVTRHWLRFASFSLNKELAQLQRTLIDLGEKHKADSIPGFTHMQAAQPISLGFHLMAYFWMLQRDVVRFRQVSENANISPLGSAALAGTSLSIDRASTAKELGFEGPMQNALDAGSDRDFIGDALHACAMLMQHLSRLCQELVLWSGPMYGFVTLDEAYTTGSSIMPQKRNPDMAELIRGRSARVIGHWTAFMSMMKALPLGYNRDQQEDKPALFDSFKLCAHSLQLSSEMLATATFNTERMAAVAGDGFATATGVAEAFVKGGMAFRSAHELTGQLVRKCEEQGVALHELKTGDTATDEILRNATVEKSIASRDSYGGPAPSAMDIQISEAKATLERDPFCHPDEGGISNFADK